MQCSSCGEGCPVDHGSGRQTLTTNGVTHGCRDCVDALICTEPTAVWPADTTGRLLCQAGVHVFSWDGPKRCACGALERQF